MEDFFRSPSPESRIKAAIVSRYFEVWALIIGKHAGRLVYLDLFCGPGVYENGEKSTPILVLDKAIADDRIRTKLASLFNDKNPRYTKSIREAIAELPGVSSLACAPKVWTSEVGEEIAQLLEETPLHPTLCFVDPWGYKGLSVRLITAVLKNWGCECVFFFNYDRVNRDLTNDLVSGHMDALFTRDRADRLRQRLADLGPNDRETEVLETLSQAMLGRAKYVLPFAFGRPGVDRTSHYLIFVTNHFRGYDKMKEIMASESSSEDQGVATLRWAPAREDQHILFEFLRPLSELKDMLLRDLAGQSLSFEALYEKHSVGKPFLRPNYRAVLKELEFGGEITATSSKSKRQRGTYAKHVTIHFPEGGSHG